MKTAQYLSLKNVNISKWANGVLVTIAFKLFFREFVFGEQNKWSQAQIFIVFCKRVYNREAQGELTARKQWEGCVWEEVRWFLLRDTSITTNTRPLCWGRKHECSRLPSLQMRAHFKQHWLPIHFEQLVDI